MLVATRKGLLQLARKNGGWSIARLSFPGVAVTATLHDARDGTLYAMLKHGHFGTKLHRSDDDGETWTELPAPAFPADAAGAPTLFQIWTLETGGADEPGRLWAGALPAGLFRSDDRGEHWQQVSALWNVPEREKWFGGGYDDAGIHTILPDPRDANRMFVAISCGGVWDTLDAGERPGAARRRAWSRPICRRNWPAQQETQDPHRVARCAAAPDTMWMQHHCGIFRSTDAGAPGRQLKLPVDDFGFAVAAHPKDPLTAWFVPAIKDELRVPRDGALGRDAHPRRRQDLGELPRRPAAARRLRSDLPPRPRRR